MGIQLFLGKPPQHIEQVIIKRMSLKEPLCFTAVDAGATITFKKIGNPDEADIETSIDKQNWQPYAFNDKITLTNVGDKVYFRAADENDISFYKDLYNRYQFTTARKKIAASGNIQTLMKADGSKLDISGKKYCYRAMFYECSSLTTAPDLPATTLADWCYAQMFEACLSLTTTPDLPATTLAYRCYDFMFYECSSLTTAPDLPATTLADKCYAGMFYECYKLTSVNVNFSAWSPSDATSEWLADVASSGTFTCPAALPDSRDASHIPTGWTRIEK